MKRSHFRHLLALFIFLPLALTACGDSSSDKEVAATNFPYGADSTLQSFSSDEYSVQVTYEYNEALQVIGYTTVEEELGDIDGNDGVVYREISDITVDPSITAKYDVRNSVTKVSQTSSSPSGISFGAITSSIESRYELNEETGILETTPSRKTEYRYTYSASGQPLEGIRIETEDMETTTYTRTYSYNSSGDFTKAEYTKVYPTSVNSSYSEVTTIDYDSHGNPISEVYIQEGDRFGDGIDEATVQNTTTFANSYNNNLLSQTIITINDEVSDEETYQIDYTYNSQSQLISSTKSTTQYGDDERYDTFTIHTYTYDSAGRLLSDSREYNYDRDENESIDYLSRTNLVWEYNQDGLMTSKIDEHLEDSDLTNETLSSHHKSKYTYQYTNNGNISRRTSEDLQDSNLDGVCDETTYDEVFTYTYNDDGYLNSHIWAEHRYTEGEISSSNTEEQTLTYTDGVLTEAETTDTDSDSEEPSSSLTSLSYDDSGKFIRYEAQSGDNTITFNLTYNDSQIVTLSSLRNDEEQMTMEVDFSTEGVPSGTDSFAPAPLTIEYPNTPGSSGNFNDFASGMRVADDNDKVYPFNVKYPKMLMFIFNSEMGGK